MYTASSLTDSTNTQISVLPWSLEMVARITKLGLMAQLLLEKSDHVQAPQSCMLHNTFNEG